MRELKFRRTHIDYDGKFEAFTYWGPTKDGFANPGSISGCVFKDDEQFTGLKYKNGVEICEGDIVAVESHYNGDTFIKEHIDSIIFECGGFELKKHHGYCLSMLVPNGYCRHIGNIHQTPELLK